jgi:hypothetical protein
MFNVIVVIKNIKLNITIIINKIIMEKYIVINVLIQYYLRATIAQDGTITFYKKKELINVKLTKIFYGRKRFLQEIIILVKNAEKESLW